MSAAPGPRRRTLTALAVASAVGGCVTMHAPLGREAGYPPDWPDPAGLGPECRALDGRYANDGVIVAGDGARQPVSLASLLDVAGRAGEVTLAVATRKVDAHGDSFATLDVVPDGDAARRRRLEGCYCVKQTLACTQITETYWSIANLGVGGRQTNVYLSAAADGSLIARLQDYRADVILAVPVFRLREPWLRFPRAAP